MILEAGDVITLDSYVDGKEEITVLYKDSAEHTYVGIDKDMYIVMFSWERNGKTEVLHSYDSISLAKIMRDRAR